MASVKITFGSDSGFEESLKKALSITENARPLLEVCQFELLGAVDRRFKQQGPGWEPLAERTIMKRRNKDKDSIQILSDTGDLKNSIVGAASGGADSIYSMSDRELIIGSSLIKANTHQYGNPDGFGRGIRIPARPYLPTPEEMVPALTDKLERMLRKLLV